VFGEAQEVDILVHVVGVFAAKVVKVAKAAKVVKVAKAAFVLAFRGGYAQFVYLVHRTSLYS
jgi:hypothetical protein